MREIKFRAFIDGEMISADDLAFDEYAPLIDQLANCDNIMQFTGLTDKNGVEIYEGDIVSQERNCIHHAGRHNKKVNFDFDQFLSGNCSLLCAVNSFDAEVVGNIHQNPELLTA